MSVSQSGDGPWISLLSRALRLWVRSRCDQADRLDLQLHGSVLSLLKGRLEGVDLRAQGVVFKGLKLEKVQVRGEAVRAHLQRGGGPLLQLMDPFLVRGMVRLPVSALTISLQQPSWLWLGAWLAETLLQQPTLSAIEASGECLALHGSGGDSGSSPTATVRVRPSVEEGRLLLQQVDGPAVARFPADPALNFTSAEVSCDCLALAGIARVIP